MVPRELGEAARSGVIDAGLMAAADYFTVDGTFDLVSPQLGVAAREHVRSVVLLAHHPPRRLDGKRIGVTGESATSKRLLELLARARWRIDPIWVPEKEIEGEPLEGVDALLLIGDRALAVVASEDLGGWGRAIDLAAEWWAWQSLPFVFGVWAVRQGVPRRERERFAGFLSGSLAVGSQHLADIAERHAGPLGEPDVLRAYLENFTYRIGSAEREGLQRFRDLLADHDIQEYQQARV